MDCRVQPGNDEAGIAMVRTAHSDAAAPRVGRDLTKPLGNLRFAAARGAFDASRPEVATLSLRHCERSEAIQSGDEAWIASSLRSSQ
jgi:hypothetical protein